MEDIILNTDGLLEILDASLHDKDSQVNVDNPKLHELIKQQAVHGPVAKYMIEHSRDNATVQYFTEVLGRGIRKFHLFLSEQERVSRGFADEGIPHAILKGAAAAIYYPEPESRSMGDLDIIVAPEKFQEAEALLMQWGYEREERLINPRHVTFQGKRGIEIELHRKFSSSNKESENAQLDQRLYEALTTECNADCAGYSFTMLPPPENGLVLLAHIYQHLGDGIGFRQILDWMVYAEHELDDEAWKNHFRQMAEAIGMETLAITVTRLCKQYLGMRKDITWCDVAEPQLVDNLLEYILRNGNFGTGLGSDKRRTFTVLRSFADPVTAYKRLQLLGLCNWKAARENRFLRPFAWVYQIGRTIRLGFARRESLKNLKDEYGQGRRDIQLLNKLGVTK